MKITRSLFIQRVLWLALLAPQFCLLLFIAYGDLRNLRDSFQPYEGLICGNSVPRFDPWEIAFELAGIISIIGLCGWQWWARGLYILFAGGAIAAMVPDIRHPPPSGEGIELVIEVLALMMVLGTVGRCVWPQRLLSRQAE